MSGKKRKKVKRCRRGKSEKNKQQKMIVREQITKKYELDPQSYYNNIDGVCSIFAEVI